jgi:hypothetical protein
MKRYKYWTTEDEQFLIEFYPIFGVRYCADKLSRNKKIQSNQKRCRKCWLENLQSCPISKEFLHWLLWNYSTKEISKYLRHGIATIYKWAKENNIERIPKGYRKKIKRGIITDYQI